jgi:hypothetical protein
MNFVAVCSQRRADRAHKLSFGHGEQQFISRSNPAQAPAPARRFAVHFIAIKRRPRIDFNQCLAGSADSRRTEDRPHKSSSQPRTRRSDGGAGQRRATADHIGGLLRNPDHRRVDVAADEIRHHRCIDHTQFLTRMRFTRCACEARSCRRGYVRRSLRSHSDPGGWWNACRCGFRPHHRRP